MVTDITAYIFLRIAKVHKQGQELKIGFLETVLTVYLTY
jgi:hypothetical protein